MLLTRTGHYGYKVAQFPPHPMRSTARMGAQPPAARRSRLNLILRAVLTLAAAVTIAVALAPARAPAGEPATVMDFLALVNGDRVGRGLPVLALEPVLVDEADRHTQQMSGAGTLYHSSSISPACGPWD